MRSSIAGGPGSPVAPSTSGGSSAWATERLAAVARLLAATGERLRAGDRIITGSIVQVPLEPGVEVVAELDGLGRVGLTIAGSR